MVQVLPEVQSFGTQLARGLGSGFSQGVERQLQFSNQMKLEQAKKKSFLDALDNEKFETGIGTIQAMREIANKRNIGRGSSITGFFPGETQKDRSEFAQLGKSLIPLVAAGVPIRNQREFEEYKKVITDPSSPLSEIEGALNGLERIFNDKIKGKGEEKEEKGKSKKIKFNTSNPEHKAKRDQVLRDAKGDREKAEKILRREFDL